MPVWPANVFSSVPVALRPSSSSCSNSIAIEVRASGSASHGRSDSRSAAAARHPSGDRQLDGALDRATCRPRSVRARRSRPGPGRCPVRGSGAGRGPAGAGSSQRDLVAGEQEPPEAEGVAQLGCLGDRASAVGAVARRRLQLGDARLEVADEGAGDRVGRGQRALGQGRQADVADADLEEGRPPARPRSRRGSGRARRAGRRRRGHRGRGSGSAFLRERLDERGLRRDVRGVELELLEAGRADLPVPGR